MAGRAAAPLVLAALALAGCAREDEAALRERLSQWFALGETRAFAARAGCAAATFTVVDERVRSALPRRRGVAGFLQALEARGRAALDDPARSPDAGMVALANAARGTGMALRRAALEGRACMDETTTSAFRYALDNPRALLGWDGASGTLVLLDPDTGLLVAAMGER
jgi:hypothetical protein